MSHTLSLIAREDRRARQRCPGIHRYREIGRARPPGAAGQSAPWLAHAPRLGVEITTAEQESSSPLAAGERHGAARALLDALEPGLGANSALVAQVRRDCRD